MKSKKPHVSRSRFGRRPPPVFERRKSLAEVPLPNDGKSRQMKKRKKSGRGHTAGSRSEEEKEGEGRHAAMCTMPLPTATDGTLPLDTVLRACLRAFAPTHNDLENARRVLRDVNSAVANLGVCVRVFGSWNTGTWIPSSDMDLVASQIDSTAKRTASGSEWALLRELGAFPSSRRDLKRNSGGILRGLSNRLRSFRQFYKICSITRARVPIVKAVHCTGISVDICFHEDGVLTSEYLCREFEKPQFALARGLIIMVKALVASWSLDDPSTGGLGSFPISLMVLWFLYSEAAVKYPSDSDKSYAICLVGFLKYYGQQFDYRKMCIDYANKRIFNKSGSQELCIINPLRSGHNCASAATRFAPNVVPKFIETYECFAKCMDHAADVARVRCVAVETFGRSIAARNVGQGLCRAELSQHLWEDGTRFYIGNPVVGA